MRIAVRIVQWLVGLLFIVSGLVKANDPLGLAYKMQEYFELWNTSLQGGNFFLKTPLISLFDLLHDHSLALSIFMITLEIAAGVALLVGWNRKLILWMLLVLILFFTFLTGYAYLSGKFTNCGCFGDCIPITPGTSFTKDILLTALILFLLIGKRYIEPVFTAGKRNFLMLASIFLVLVLQWYALNYLPLADCLPFKKGNNISEQMKPPPGSVTDSTAIRYIYEKDGKRYEWSPEELPADFTTYTYIDRIDKLVRKGNAQPAIKGLQLVGASGMDSTEAVLQLPKVLLIFCMDVGTGEDWTKSLRGRNFSMPAFIVTSATYSRAVGVLQQEGVQLPVFSCDNTIVKTAARTDPTFYYLENGTVKRKWSAGENADAVSFTSTK